MSECSIALAAKPAAPVSSPAPSGILQRQCACGQHATGGECEECKKKQTTLQRKPAGASPPVAPPIVHEALRSPAEPLPADSRSFFEPRFGQRFSHVPGRRFEPPSVPLKIGHPDDRLEKDAENSAQRVLSTDDTSADQAGVDLSQVRVHTGSQAAEAARAVGSRAFTVGRDLVFNAGEYQPQSPRGRRLLAHELSHVIQQTTSPGPEPGLFRQIAVSPPDPVNAVPPPGVTPDTDGQPNSQTDAKKDGKADAAGAKKADGDTSAPSDDAPGTPAAKAAKVGAPAKGAAETDAKSKVSKIANQSPTGKDAAPDKDDKQAGAEAKAEAQSVTDLGTGDLSTIDAELAEHQRWGAAAATVGAAGSGERAQFIAQSAASGSAFGEALLKGAATGAGMKIAEKAVEKGALRLAARFAPQVAKFTPLPAVGAVIGGVMSAYDLASRDWKATGESIGRFGQGADIYETLANSIESISTILDVATAVLNVIAGIIGAISIAMWIITIITVGVASPLALTLSTIAGGIGLASLILDGINAMVLKQLITLFRALHTFTSDADPRDVVVQGDAISKASGAATGFVGGFAGGMVGGAAAEKGIKMGAKAMAKPPSTPVPDHPIPPAAPGDGPGVKAMAPEGKAATEVKAAPGTEASAKPAPPAEIAPAPKKSGAPEVATPEAAKTKPGDADVKPAAEKPAPKPKKAPVGETDFSEAGEVAKEMHEGAFGDKLEAARNQAAKAPPTAPPGSKWNYKLLRNLLRNEQGQPPGAQAQHWTKWLASTRDLPANRRMTAEMISQNRSWLQTNKNRPATLLLSDPLGGGTRYFIGDKPVPRSSGPQLELRGFEQPKPEPRYTTEHRLADKYFIPEATKPAPDPNLVNLWAGGEARFRMEGTPGQGDWGWQPQASSSARQPVQMQFPFPGGPARSAAVPHAVDPRQLSFDFSKPAADPRQLQLFPEATGKSPSSQAAPSVSTAPVSPSALTAPEAAVGQPESLLKPSPDVVLPQQAPDSTGAPGVESKAAVTEQNEPPQGLSEGEKLAPIRNLGLAARQGEPGAKEEESRFQRNLRQFSETDPELMKAARVGMYVPSGAALSATAFTAAAARTEGRSFEQARREPVVEHVNPHYPPPPCSPQEIVDVQNQILQTLDAREKTEAASSEMASQQAHHKANQKPLTDMQKGTDDALSATEAHKQAVARRTDANQKKKKNEDQAASALSDYTNRAAKLSTITIPMRGFERFTSLAYSMPDDPQVLPLAVQPFSGTIIRAKKAILKMNTDSKNFLKQLDTMDSTIKDQKATQSDRDKQVQADANTLSDTKQKAGESDQSLNQAKQTTQDLDNTNKERLDQATKIRNEADQTSATLDSQAQQKQAKAQSMAAALQAWAPQHRQVRLDALEQTRKSLEQQGYKIIEVKEL